MLSDGIAQQEGKGLAPHNYSRVGVGLVSPTTQGGGQGEDLILPVPAPQELEGALAPHPVSLNQLIAGVEERPISQPDWGCGEAKFQTNRTLEDETTGFPIHLHLQHDLFRSSALITLLNQ